METMLPWIQEYKAPAIVLLLTLGIAGLLISDETLLLVVDSLSSTSDLSTPLSPSAALAGTTYGVTIRDDHGHFLGARVRREVDR